MSLKLHIVAAFDENGANPKILAHGSDAQVCADVFRATRDKGEVANLVFVRNAHAHKRWRNPELCKVSKASAPEGEVEFADEVESAPVKAKRGRPAKTAAKADAETADAANGS